MSKKNKGKVASIFDLWQKQENKAKADPEVITLGDDSQTNCSGSPSCSTTPKPQDSKGQSFFRTPTSFFNSRRSTPGSNKVSKLKKHELAGLVLNESAAQTIVFPIKDHIRTYEFHLVKSCIALNTSVCLPFNISTNFVISTVFFNFLRWFPDSRLVYCYTSMEEGQDFIEICKNNNVPDADIILIPVYQNFKKAVEKNARIIVTSVQCMIKIVENEKDFCQKIRCLALQMDAGETVAKQKKIVGPLVSIGIVFRIIVSYPCLPDGSRRTSSISKRQQLITSLLLSQWEELSGVDRIFRCDAVPLGITPLIWNESDVSSEIKYIMEHLGLLMKPFLETLKDHFHLPSLELQDIFNFKWDLFGDTVPGNMRKELNLTMFFFDVYRNLFLFGPRALWLYMTDFLNNPQNSEKAEEVQMFILSDKKISRNFDKIQGEYANFTDARTNGQKVYKSHVKFLLIRDQLISWIKTGLPTHGVILCYDMSTARCVAESLIGLEDALVRLVSDEAHGLNFPFLNILPVTRMSGTFHAAKNVIVILPLSLPDSLSALDTFTSNGLRFVLATERRAICLLEHDVAHYIAVLDDKLEKLRSSDGRLVRKVQETSGRRSLSGRVGVVDKYDFKFEQSRMILNPDLFTVVPSQLKPADDNIEKKVLKRKPAGLKTEQKTEYMSEEENQMYQKFVGQDEIPKQGLFSKRRILGLEYAPGSYSNLTFQTWACFNRQGKFSCNTTVGRTFLQVLRDEESEVLKRRRNYNYDTSLIDRQKIQKYKTLIDKLNVYWNKG